MSFNKLPETCLDKKYEFMETVRISCEEYRDLIKEVSELRICLEQEKNDYMHAVIELREVKTELADLKSQLKEVK